MLLNELTYDHRQMCPDQIVTVVSTQAVTPPATCADRAEN
jgi:hypothetical protein